MKQLAKIGFLVGSVYMIGINELISIVLLSCFSMLKFIEVLSEARIIYTLNKVIKMIIKESVVTLVGSLLSFYILSLFVHVQIKGYYLMIIVVCLSWMIQIITINYQYVENLPLRRLVYMLYFFLTLFLTAYTKYQIDSLLISSLIPTGLLAFQMYFISKQKVQLDK